MISMRRAGLAPRSRCALRELIPGALCVAIIAYLIHEEVTSTGGGPAIARLRHGGEEERVAACQALGQLQGEESGTVVAELVAASRDPSSIVRREAVDALRRIGARSEVVLSALVEAVEDEDAVVRTRAVLALGTLRTATPPVTAALTTALVDPDPEVREAAATALGVMDPPAERGIAALRAAVEDEDERVRAAASAYFRSRRPSPRLLPACPWRAVP